MKKYDDNYELVNESINGNQRAFSELLNRYKNLIYSIVLRMLNDTEEANDLVQEIFIKIYRNLDKYHAEFQFSTWIIRIATNHVIDYRRKKKQETLSVDDLMNEPANYITPEQEIIRKERLKGVSQAISLLPEIYKVPIVLFHQQGLRYQEIANVLGEPLSKIKNRIFRGRKMLKENLKTQVSDLY